METIRSSETQRARAIADEYRSKGYEVIESPSPEQLPDFLSGHSPNLLVRKNGETTVVEVKSRSSLAKAPEIRDLARLLRDKPHWHFELVVVGEADQLGTPEGATPLERDEVLERLNAAERLLESGSPEAAFLLAWSSLEAAVRLLMQKEGIELDRFTPAYLLTQAVMNGMIARDDYKFLTNAMSYRNAIVHGFKVPEFDPALARRLIKMTSRLLPRAGTQASA